MASRTALQLLITLVLFALPLTAGQGVRGAAPPDAPTYALVNARIVPVSARPIPSGTLVLRDGRSPPSARTSIRRPTPSS